jgi:ABC-2 type transport system ATP-binding protein
MAVEHGKTVFLSSHQLGEVEQICDRVAIINNGELLREGKVLDLVSEKARFRIRVKPLDQAVSVVNEHWAVVAKTDDALLIDVQEDDIPAIVEKLVEKRIQVFELSPYRQSLEEFYLSVTGRENQHVD